MLSFLNKKINKETNFNIIPGKIPILKMAKYH